MMLTLFETLLLGIFIAAIVVASHWFGQQAYTWMPVAATAEAEQVDRLFSFLVAVGAFIFLGVIGIILYSILFFRAPTGDYSEGHPSRGDARIEILWTAVPTVLVLWIAFQSYDIYERLQILGLTPVVHLHLQEPAVAQTVQNQAKPAVEQIEVIAKQWVWSFRYPNNITSNELHLPAHRSVRLVLHSQDVIHGFYVPEFRVKQDIIPARTITLVLTPNRTGKYRLRDSQFSGTYFALMEADVYVESPTAYSHWLEQATQQQKKTAVNPAFSAGAQSEKTLLNSGWRTGSFKNYT